MKPWIAEPNITTEINVSAAPAISTPQKLAGRRYTLSGRDPPMRGQVA